MIALNIMWRAKQTVMGYMDESRIDGVTDVVKKDNKTLEFTYHNVRCFKIKIPENIGPAQAIYYDVKSLIECCKYIKEKRISHSIVYIMACRIGPFMKHFYKGIHRLGGKIYLNPDGECEIIWTTRKSPDFMRVCAA